MIFWDLTTNELNISGIVSSSVGKSRNLDVILWSFHFIRGMSVGSCQDCLAKSSAWWAWTNAESWTHSWKAWRRQFAGGEARKSSDQERHQIPGKWWKCDGSENVMAFFGRFIVIFRGWPWLGPTNHRSTFGASKHGVSSKSSPCTPIHCWWNPTNVGNPK